MLSANNMQTIYLIFYFATAFTIERIIIRFQRAALHAARIALQPSQAGILFRASIITASANIVG
jgi:hypothetical protein